MLTNFAIGTRMPGPRALAVGLKHKGKVNHVVVDAEDALIAALKARTEPRARVDARRPVAMTC